MACPSILAEEPAAASTRSNPPKAVLQYLSQACGPSQTAPLRPCVGSLRRTLDRPPDPDCRKDNCHRQNKAARRLPATPRLRADIPPDRAPHNRPSHSRALTYSSSSQRRALSRDNAPLTRNPDSGLPDKAAPVPRQVA